MTTYYVKGATGNNASSGVDWANAVQTVAGALAKATPTLIYVDASESFTAAAAITWTFPNANVAVISVTSGTTTWATGAKESVGASATAFTITGSNVGSFVFIYGMTIEAGTTANSTIIIGNAGPFIGQFKSCVFNVPNTGSGGQINLGSSVTTSSRGNWLKFEDCTMQMKNSTSNGGITLGNAQVTFTNLTLTTQASVPTKIFQNPDQRYGGGTCYVIDSDLSGFNPASSFLTTGVDNYMNLTFRNCKLGSNVTAQTGTWQKSTGSITLINCDSGDTINTFEHHSYTGSLTEDAAIYKDSGASFSGSGVSWKVVTTAACDEHNPFTVPRLYRWNTLTASTNFKVDFIINSAGTALTDKEIWLEIGYPSSTSTPVGTHTTDRNANPITGSGANQTTSSATWTGATTPTKQYCDITATPAEVGMIQGEIFVCKASATVYIDPQLQIA